MEVEKRLIEMIREVSGVKKIEITDILESDLGMDSLDSVELSFFIEEEFDFEIPDNEIEKMKTVLDVIKYVNLRINRKNNGYFSI